MRSKLRSNSPTVLERQLPDLEIRQVVLTLEVLSVIDARRADVDAHYGGVGSTHGVLGGLPGATSCDQNVQVGAVRATGPYQVILGAMAILIAPLRARTSQVRDRRGIGVPGVELGHRVRVHIRCAVDADADDASHDRW
jgi:hypothetical protein